MLFIVATFFISFIGISVIIGRQVIVNGKIKSSILPAVRKPGSDIMYVFAPIILFLRHRGVFGQVNYVCRSILFAVRYGIVESCRNARKYVFSKTAEIAQHLHDKENVTKEKSAASFFLKDIAEHKKQINKESSPDPSE